MNDESFLLTSLRVLRERWFAFKSCRELLQIYRTVAVRCPHLSRIETYKEVVAARTGGDQATVSKILERAEESFASWPASRPLNLRDVIHYLVVSEFLATHGEAQWIQANVKRTVDSSIPHDL